MHYPGRPVELENRIANLTAVVAGLEQTIAYLAELVTRLEAQMDTRIEIAEEEPIGAIFEDPV